MLQNVIDKRIKHMNHLMNTYRRLPITLERGEGVWLWDTNGNKYLDVLSGIAVTGLGHAHPTITKTIQEQAAKLLHTSNLYQIAPQSVLADKLCEISGLDEVFFCNSGAEAVEAALKLTRLYGHQKGIGFPQIITMNNAFHGRTFATISAGGNTKVQAGFEPLVPGFIHVPFNNVEAIKSQSENPAIAAIMVEPIQGEGGIIVPDEQYLQALRALCDEQGWLLIADEIQCGMGRTGTFYAYQAAGILPDIVTMAKGLANGIPIGACLAKASVAQLFHPGNHGSTFGGNPLACATGLATVTTIAQEKLWENAKKQGTLLLNGLKAQLKNNPHVIEVRGKGLMIGIELDRPCRELLGLAAKDGLLFNNTKENVIRLLPPLIIEEQHIQIILDKLPKLIASFIKNSTAEKLK